MAKYWVGGSGSWNDTNHWSSESGGSGGAGEPAGWEDAVFDANSFTASGQTISISTQGSVNSLDTRNVTNNPTFNITDGIYVWRWMRLSANMSLTGSGYMIFASDVEAQQEIDFAGLSAPGIIRFTGGGNWKALSDFKNSNDFDFRQGTLDMNGFDISTYTFWCDASGNVRHLKLGTGTLKAVNLNITGGANLTVDDTDYTIECGYQYSVTNFSTNRLLVKDTLTAVMENDLTFRELIIEPSGYLVIRAGKTITVTDLLSITGKEVDLTDMVDQDDGGNYSIDVTGATVRIDQAYIKHAQIVGGPITVYRCFNAGDTSGITFSSDVPPWLANKVLHHGSVLRTRKRLN
jgi:hypothetical protein